MMMMRGLYSCLLLTTVVASLVVQAAAGLKGASVGSTGEVDGLVTATLVKHHEDRDRTRVLKKEEGKKKSHKGAKKDGKKEEKKKKSEKKSKKNKKKCKKAKKSSRRQRRLQGRNLEDAISYCLHGPGTAAACSKLTGNKAAEDFQAPPVGTRQGLVEGRVQMEFAHPRNNKDSAALEQAAKRVLELKTPTKFLGCDDHNRRRGLQGTHADGDHEIVEVEETDNALSVTGLQFGKLLVGDCPTSTSGRNAMACSQLSAPVDIFYQGSHDPTKEETQEMFDLLEVTLQAQAASGDFAQTGTGTTLQKVNVVSGDHDDHDGSGNTNVEERTEQDEPARGGDGSRGSDGSGQDDKSDSDKKKSAGLFSIPGVAVVVAVIVGGLFYKRHLDRQAEAEGTDKGGDTEESDDEPGVPQAQVVAVLDDNDKGKKTHETKTSIALQQAGK